MNSEVEKQEFHPELASRRGELFAWGSTLLVDGVWIILILTGQPSSLWLPILGIPLALVACGISLSNWMDRHTLIKLGDQDIYFSNGLRRIKLLWKEIVEVRVLPAQWGKKVQVFSENAYFGFHTLGEVIAHGKILGRTGFVEGDFILEVILDRADLSTEKQVDTGGQQEGYYYSRK